MALHAFVVENHFHLLVTPRPKKHLATRLTCYGRDTQQRRIGGNRRFNFLRPGSRWASSSSEPDSSLGAEPSFSPGPEQAAMPRPRSGARG